MRLDKALSIAGYTRKQAKAMIRAGRISVGGAVANDPAAQADPGSIFIDGRKADIAMELYWMIHKPQGVVTATEDARDRTVVDLLPEDIRRRAIGPVGRLDKDVTGLVLLTTDGQLAHRLISPKWTVEKVYRATVEGALDETHVNRMAGGIALHDFTAKPARLIIVESGEQSICELAVTEGKYHQVKRMFSALGHPVIALHRASIGGVALDAALAPGESRPLTDREIDRLYAAVRLERN